MIVLLNVALMWATPTGTFWRTFFFPFFLNVAIVPPNSRVPRGRDIPSLYFFVGSFFLAQVPFHVKMGVDDVPDARDLVLRQGVRPRVGGYPSIRQNPQGRRRTDPVDIGKRRPDLLGLRNVDSGYPCQTCLLPTLPGRSRFTPVAACVSGFRQ